ncbi:hypothetical protein GW17_00040181 [Ensete ventricosum]|nr:hypothetical protein GW17_00040181 [Ensete ventricosum]
MSIDLTLFSSTEAPRPSVRRPRNHTKLYASSAKDTNSIKEPSTIVPRPTGIKVTLENSTRRLALSQKLSLHSEHLDHLDQVNLPRFINTPIVPLIERPFGSGGVSAFGRIGIEEWRRFIIYFRYLRALW